jgi:hypothetical protein
LLQKYEQFTRERYCIKVDADGKIYTLDRISSTMLALKALFKICCLFVNELLFLTLNNCLICEKTFPAGKVSSFRTSSCVLLHLLPSFAFAIVDSPKVKNILEGTFYKKQKSCKKIKNKRATKHNKTSPTPKAHNFNPFGT